MTSNEAHQNTSDHTGDNIRRRRHFGLTQERIAAGVRMWGPVLWTLARIIWHLATEADIHIDHDAHGDGSAH
ncbi:hypothetical protein AB0E08_46240 [Streptomyces sp. NPDC048281]|uniref:hypothetical protein n=1 Tax=Streptomyces sp. NPDC048281 TaxID=3154715 RepID=UPI0034489F42